MKKTHYNKITFSMTYYGQIERLQYQLDFFSDQDQEIKDKLIKNTSEAVEKGVFGAPSLLVNNELFFGKETLQDVEELLVKETG